LIGRQHGECPSFEEMVNKSSRDKEEGMKCPGSQYGSRRSFG
jgi:hypothetical protein